MKRTTIRCLSVLLVLGLVLTLGITTAMAETAINTVSVTGIVEPQVGNHPSQSITLPDNIQLDSIRPEVIWYSYSSVSAYGNPNVDKVLTASDVFQEGTKYGFELILAPASSDYIFATKAADWSATVNGKPATVQTSSKSRIFLYYNFGEPSAAPVTIDSIAITGIIEPEAGKTPSQSVTFPENVEFLSSVQRVIWYSYEGLNSNGVPSSTGLTTLSASDAFVSGKKYGIELILQPKGENTFITHGVKPTATVNGNPAVIDNAYANRVFLFYTFGELAAAPTPITAIDLTGIVPPEVGQKPSQSVTFPEDVEFWANRQEIIWYSYEELLSSGLPAGSGVKMLSPSDTFEAGKNMARS